jgi:hypothetical protein
MMTTTDITRAAARRTTRRIAWVAVLAVLLGAVAILGAQRATPPVAVAAQDDFAGLMDIGGRRLYLECQGTGSPTVLLENGAGLGADIWSVDFGGGPSFMVGS